MARMAGLPSCRPPIKWGTVTTNPELPTDQSPPSILPRLGIVVTVPDSARHLAIDGTGGVELTLDVLLTFGAWHAVALLELRLEPVDPGEKVLCVRLRVRGLPGHFHVNRARVRLDAPC